MRWRASSRILALTISSVAMLSAAQVATADCDGPKRPPTAAEAKAYADGFVLFRRMAPQAPAGWTATDSRTEPVVTFICASPTYDFTRWSFSRTFNRSQAEMQARGAAALKKTQAVRARADARNKAKEAKLADLDRRQSRALRLADVDRRLAVAGGANAAPVLVRIVPVVAFLGEGAAAGANRAQSQAGERLQDMTSLHEIELPLRARVRARD